MADAPPLKHLTLLLLHQAARRRVLLGLKKRGFGAGRWNGFGGKIEPGETVLAAALREMREESGLAVRDARYAAHVVFAFEGQRERMSVHVLAASDAGGGADEESPPESDEMRPRWFATDAVPYDEMWLDDRDWLPLLLAGKTFEAFFLFRGHESILERRVAEVPPERWRSAELAVHVPLGAPPQASIAPSFGADAGAGAGAGRDGAEPS